jgi:hypothetical protein
MEGSADLVLLPKRETVFVLCVYFYEVQWQARVGLSVRIGSQLF